jgi:hypothetical protein
MSINRQEFTHFAAYLSKTRFSKTHIQVDRRKRIDGNSKMNFDPLMMQGLMSLIEYSEQLLFFFIRILLAMLVFLAGVAGYVVYEKLTMDNPRRTTLLHRHPSHHPISSNPRFSLCRVAILRTWHWEIGGIENSIFFSVANSLFGLPLYGDPESGNFDII